MKKYDTIIIVGAGGIGCHLIPMLSFLAVKTIIIDGDTYEPDNCKRQFPALQSTENKAKVMWDIVRARTTGEVAYLPEYVTPENLNRLTSLAPDLIVSCVDNNETRTILANLCYHLGIPGIMAGNSESFGEAHLILPPLHDPFEHFEFPMKGRQPWGCNTDKELDERPQTAVANMLAAGAAMAIFNSLRVTKKPENVMAWCHVDGPQAQTKRVKDFMLADQEPELVN